MKISIITACYNSAATLCSAIESVLCQTYPDIEYLIIDGNSQDESVDIIRSYEPAFNGHLKWISEPDRGMYDAMNKGIRMSTGDFVAILNADDFYNYPESVETTVNYLLETGVELCYSDVRFVHPYDLKKTMRYYSSAKFKPSLFRFGFMPAHPSCFIRRELFDEIGYYKTGYHIAADYELLIRFLYTHRISYRYLAFDIIKMRTGGRSTKSWKSNYLLNKEIVRACRENGIYTNLLLLSFKYGLKIFEWVFTKNK
ncbi:MAG: glycosyltransferase [Dysgonamonadaceae bacterium]|jgi:glycosyltransferase involved in cell wall biosynthesis|nr:glycosyltransferase [Dysgonamonadaceae bacterium]